VTRNVIANSRNAQSLNDIYVKQVFDENFRQINKDLDAPLTLKQRILNKIPFTKSWKAAKYTSSYGNTLKTFGRVKFFSISAGRIFSGVKAGGKLGVTAAIAGGAVYIISGGDWPATMSAVGLVVLTNYGPRLVQAIMVRIIPNFTARMAALAGTNQALTAAEALQQPIPVYGQIAFIAKKGIEAAINLAFSVYNTIVLDLTLFTIRSAAGNVVDNERKALACQDFNVPKKPLLSPPNCSPSVEFGEPINSWKDVYTGSFLTSAGLFGGASGCLVLPVSVVSAAAANLCWIPVIAAIGSFAPTVISLSNEVINNPSAIIPKTQCNPAAGTATCDREYLGQDCPNWFLSDPGGGSALAGGTFVGLLQGGPACAALSAFGAAGMFCDAARVSAAMGTYAGFPGEVTNFMLQAYEVGVHKSNIGVRTDAPLEGEFASNDGYWYAELPYAIEFIKTQEGDFIIHKA
jgi:hypothetical protein